MSHVKISFNLIRGFYFAHHVFERLEQRTVMSRDEVWFALNHRHDIPLGNDKKKGVMHRLVYSTKSNLYAIAVVDMDQRMVITVLPLSIQNG